MKNKKKAPVRIILEALDATGYHLFINAQVNGKRCRFLIDTGASHSVVDKAYFEKHFDKKNLKTVKQATTGLHSSTTESYFGKIKELKMGSILAKNYMAAAVDLAHVNQTYKQLKKPSIQGILGSDLLLKFKAKINYETLKVEF
ncbi:MAG TPA: retropepsin-like aspartic protease [Chitinophagales bacterium]|nr:retropepsin-like aspartic protease [Chitinophagales bacterium]